MGLLQSLFLTKFTNHTLVLQNKQEINREHMENTHLANLYSLVHILVEETNTGKVLFNIQTTC